MVSTIEVWKVSIEGLCFEVPFAKPFMAQKPPLGQSVGHH
jgi:hypothetical protein